MIGLPPFEAGALQVSWIWVLVRWLTLRLVGAPGTVTSVVAWTMLDQGLSPAVLIAATR